MSAPTPPARIIASRELVADDERTETVKERTWWEVRSRKADKPWKYAGHTSHQHEVDAFVARGLREGFDVQVWEMVAVERTVRSKKLETRSATD